MCFYSDTNKTKIASKPIKVYKVLNGNNMAPSMLYKYVKGLNTSEHPEDGFTYDKYDDIYYYGSGWLHTLKHFRREDREIWLRFNPQRVVMFIPKGCEYHDAGIATEGLQDCTNHIISKALYWPKNWFDYLRWFIKSL